MEIVATGVFRLKGSQLLELARTRGVQNAHQVSMRSGVSYPTIHRYFEKPREVESVSLKALAGFLVDGLGLTPEQVAKLQFGDVFEFVPDSESSGAE